MVWCRTFMYTFLNFLFSIGVQLIDNVVIVPGEEQRDSGLHIHIPTLPQTRLPSGLRHNPEQSSLCYTRSFLVLHFGYSRMYISIPSSLTVPSPILLPQELAVCPLSLWICFCFLIKFLERSYVSLCCRSSFSFSFIFISWRLITSQHCSGFCHTLTWISHGVTCIPHPNSPSHLPLHLIPPGLPSAPGPSTCRMHPSWAGDLFHYR